MSLEEFEQYFPSENRPSAPFHSMFDRFPSLTSCKIFNEIKVKTKFSDSKDQKTEISVNSVSLIAKVLSHFEKENISQMPLSDFDAVFPVQEKAIICPYALF